MLVPIKQFLSDILNLRKALSGAVIEKLLWSNPSPTAAFAAQTITLPGQYDDVLIDFAYATDYTQLVGNLRIPTTGRACYLNATWGGNPVRPVRAAIKDNNTTVTFGEGVCFSLYDGSRVNSNSYCIPLQMYGIKHLGGGSSE